MRQRLAIFITVAVVLLILIGLNAASYVSVERTPDTEFSPDRSTYNSSTTGVRALYDLLAESGRPVMRWREDTHALTETETGAQPSTFVVIGKTQTPFEEDEARSLLRWVARGGRLVIVDRRPDARLLPASGKWNISAEVLQLPRADVHSDRVDEMTAGVAPVGPAQPTILTHGVEAVQPSRYAALLNISAQTAQTRRAAATGPDASPDEDTAPDEDDESPSASGKQQPPPPKPVYVNRTLASPAPLAHLQNSQGGLLVDYPYGAGRIIVLSDPYIVANGGIRLADNLQLALNIIAGGGGLIAFDEYHQGRAGTQNQFLSYFSGTPVLWMLTQLGLIVLVLIWTRGQRFARPLPLARVDRRSSLEYVASMAELQQRARAYDLAIENIYTRVRRVLVRYAGLGNNSPRTEIAARVAARSKLDRAQLESLMRDCEDAINGAPLDARRSLELVGRLRELESTLGLGMRSREARQAAEGL
ncbi:MAG TPA: DUF4350 domain-containing protein [Pyrinomonadaceae bacterium]|jgi:hypothetical protein